MPYPITREDSAVEVLLNPERFPSLHKRTDFHRQLCVWRLPSFEPHSSWSLFVADRSKDYVVRRLEHDPRRGLPSNRIDPHIFGAEAPVREAAGLKIIATFEGLSVPPFRRPGWVGLDGTYFGVHFGNNWQGTRINWWSRPSEDWSPLIATFNALIQQFEEILPASTLRQIEP